MIDRFNRLLKEPQPLLEKPLIAGMIGAAFLVAGILLLLFMKDLVFFLMSLFIAVYCIYICLRLLQQLLDKEYTVLEGKCTERLHITFSGYVRITIEDAEEGPVTCRLRKKTAEPIVQGRSYRIYFMGRREAGQRLDQHRYWAAEEI